MSASLAGFFLSLKNTGYLTTDDLRTAKNLFDTLASTTSPQEYAIQLVRCLPSLEFSVDLVLSIYDSGYDILKTLGTGGMGIVFKVTDRTAPEHATALKAIRQDRLESGLSSYRLPERFTQEIHYLTGINDPHIVRVYASYLTQEKQFPFFTMEYLVGLTFANYVQDNHPLDIPDAITFILQSAYALRTLHTKGIIHRDVKPNNLFIEASNNNLRLLDLGLARRSKSARHSHSKLV